MYINHIDNMPIILSDTNINVHIIFYLFIYVLYKLSRLLIPGNGPIVSNFTSLNFTLFVIRGSICTVYIGNCTLRPYFTIIANCMYC